MIIASFSLSNVIFVFLRNLQSVNLAVAVLLGSLTMAMVSVWRNKTALVSMTDNFLLLEQKFPISATAGKAVNNSI